MPACTQQLSVVDGIQFLDTLDLDDDLIGNNQVEPLVAKKFSTVTDGNLFLILARQLPSRELKPNRFGVDGLQ
jgi:hypothetical protein